MNCGAVCLKCDAAMTRRPRPVVVGVIFFMSRRIGVVTARPNSNDGATQRRWDVGRENVATPVEGQREIIWGQKFAGL